MYNERILPDFQMVLYSRMNYANKSAKALRSKKERECVFVCATRVPNTETKPKKTKHEDVGYMMRRRRTCHAA